MRLDCLLAKRIRRFVGGLIGFSIFGSSLTVSAQGTQNPPYAEDYQIITSDGAWCWFSDPRAIYVDNKMFGGFVDKQGSIWAFCYDPATQDRQQTKLYDKLDYDDHANPSIMALPDKRLVLFFSAHGGTKNSPIYYKISKQPADISAWGELQSVSPKMEGHLGVCYTNPAMLSAENNRVYLWNLESGECCRALQVGEQEAVQLNHVPLKVGIAEASHAQSLAESAFGLVDSSMPVYQHSINAMVMPPYLTPRSPCRARGES